MVSSSPLSLLPVISLFIPFGFQAIQKYPVSVTPSDFTFPREHPSLYLVMTRCTILLWLLKPSVGMYLSRILNGMAFMSSVLLFSFSAKRILYHHTILIKYDRIFVSCFGLSRAKYPFHSHEHVKSLLLGDISWSKVPVTTCNIAPQTDD